VTITAYTDDLHKVEKARATSTKDGRPDGVCSQVPVMTWMSLTAVRRTLCATRQRIRTMNFDANSMQRVHQPGAVRD